MSEFNTNKSELLQIADAVAKEKLIEPHLVIEAMEDSLSKAAKSKYGSEYDIQAKIDIKTGEIIEFVDDEIEKLQKKVAEKYGYELVDHKLELYGVKKKPQ